jgi:hypothetical protein
MAQLRLHQFNPYLFDFFFYLMSLVSQMDLGFATLEHYLPLIAALANKTAK